MSYLNVPRIHFAGTFQADPSTVNNNDSNFDPTVTLSWEQPVPTNPLSNTSVYWNPDGTHMFSFSACSINSVVNDQGVVTTTSAADPIGTVTSNGTYPAKIVDLDPDQQGVSQIYGLVIQVNMTDDSGNIIASVQGTMPPSAFGDLWSRVVNTNQLSNGTMCATYQAQLSNVTWTTPSASPILSSLQAISPDQLSIKFMVDSFQSDMNQGNFTYGRVVGTVGPVMAGDAPRSVPRRMVPATAQVPIQTLYGPAGFMVDTARSVLVLDIGNTDPTCAPGYPAFPQNLPTVPAAGWQIVPTTFQAVVDQASQVPVSHLKNAAAVATTPLVLGEVSIDATTYPVNAGVYDIQLTAEQITALANSPLQLNDMTLNVTAVSEDPQGRYVDVDCPFFRLGPSDTATCILWATLFGQPWVGVSLDLEIQGSVPATNGPTQAPFCWNNGDPVGGLSLPGNTQTTSVTTGSDGTAPVVLTAGTFGQVRMYPDGQQGPDGQVYFVSGSWAAWGQIFLFPGAPINALVFSNYVVPPTPTWNTDVQPILSLYARLYPYMMGIIDLGSYTAVTFSINGVETVLNLPVEDPHHMPVTRDLSPGKLAMINLWIQNGFPES